MYNRAWKIFVRILYPVLILMDLVNAYLNLTRGKYGLGAFALLAAIFVGWLWFGLEKDFEWYSRRIK